MWRKRHRLPQDLQQLGDRLHEERPQATPLQLDEIKTTAMRHAGVAKTAGRLSRRLIASSLSVGLLAAGTGGVLAANHGNFATQGNAASAQYSQGGTNITINGNGNCTVIGNGNTITCNYYAGGPPTTTVTVTASASSQVLAASTTVTPNSGVLGTSVKVNKKKKRHSKRHFVVHARHIPRNAKLRSETIRINGKVYKFILHGHHPVTLNFVGFPCTKRLQVVKITAVGTNGHVYRDKRVYHLCTPGR